MAEKSNLLQEAIIEARQVREAAIQNAYKSLEENLTPSIKEALANKLSEELDIEECEEESIEEMNNSGFKEVKALKTEANEEENEKGEEEEPVESENGEEANEDPVESNKDEKSSEEEDTVNDDAEDDDTDAEDVKDSDEVDTELADDDTVITDLTLKDLKALISDVVDQLQAIPAPESEDIASDMEAADVEGQGEEDVPIESEPAAEADDEIDLEELLKELENEEKGCKAESVVDSKELEDTKKELAEVVSENQKALKVIHDLRTTMSDVNLLNAKLVYTNRMLLQNLTESQKINVIKSFDSAKSPAEVKTVFRTLNESFRAKDTKVLREHRSIASRSAGISTANPSGNIVEVDPVVKRFQQLAGIIE